MLAVKEEGMDKAVQVKDVTANWTKSYELIKDSPFDYLLNSNYIPAEINAEARMEATKSSINTWNSRGTTINLQSQQILQQKVLINK